MKPVNFSVLSDNAVKVRIPRDVLLAITVHGADKRTGDTWHDATTTQNRCNLVACGQGWYNLSHWPHQTTDHVLDVLQQIETLQNAEPAPAKPQSDLSLAINE